jgi:hypothetical protein
MMWGAFRALAADGAWQVIDVRGLNLQAANCGPGHRRESI